MSPPDVWMFAASVAALAVPLVLASCALVSPRRSEFATRAALGLALSVAAGALFGGGGASAVPSLAPVRVDGVTCAMLLLVCGLGAVIARYSRGYLHGEPGFTRYSRWLLSTLSAVTIVLVSGDLLVIAAGWTATSVALHRLLTFYPDRPQALVAAHKKFLVSRCADICLFACLLLVRHEVGSFDLDLIAAWADEHPNLTPPMHLAAALIVVAVALRSAQVPFHGWLIQVMEAPTPVSALLHAGVVNIGGVVLIRLAPWLSHADTAQLLLVVIGLASAVVSTLVATTRVSVKVALAWSTCAQLGFMLLQCGLGLWHLALLHLVAHSLYKAHAFLTAGNAVANWRVRAASKVSAAPTPRRVVVLAIVVAAVAETCVGLVQGLDGTIPDAALSLHILALIVSLSVVPLLARTRSEHRPMSTGVASVAGIILLYVGSHVAAARLMPDLFVGSHTAGWVLASTGLLGLFVVKTTLQLHPDGALARVLYPRLFAGLYLDEIFTRLTFRWWPPTPAIDYPRASRSRLPTR